MPKYLIDETPIIMLPSLIALVGFERAGILQQVHFACQQPRSGRILDDGEKWIYNTYEDWREYYFPFWSEKTIQRHILKLEAEKLLLSTQPNIMRGDATKYYRVNEEELEKRLEAFKNTHPKLTLKNPSKNGNHKQKNNKISTPPSSNILDDAPSSNTLDDPSSNKLDHLPYTNESLTNESNNDNTETEKLSLSSGERVDFKSFVESEKESLERWKSWLLLKRKVRELKREEKWSLALWEMVRQGGTLSDAQRLYEFLEKQPWVDNVNPGLMIDQTEIYLANKARISVFKDPTETALSQPEIDLPLEETQELYEGYLISIVETIKRGEGHLSFIPKDTWEWIKEIKSAMFDLDGKEIITFERVREILEPVFTGNPGELAKIEKLIFEKEKANR